MFKNFLNFFLKNYFFLKIFFNLQKSKKFYFVRKTKAAELTKSGPCSTVTRQSSSDEEPDFWWWTACGVCGVAAAAAAAVGDGPM